MRMSKVAVFGNAGGGKSTLARRLAEVTGLPLHVIDKIQFEGRYRPDAKDGGKVPHEEYLRIHADLISRDRWIIDGFESVALAWERFAAADTLVYVDLPVLHALLVRHQAPPQGPVRQSSGLAGEQPAVEQHARQLPRDLALPSPLDAEIPAACR